MLSLLASLAFIAAAVAAVAVVRVTWIEYRDIALGNVAALGDLTDAREFRVTIAGRGRKPTLAVRRQPHRAAPARAAVRARAATRVAA